MTVTVARHGSPSVDEEVVERLAEELEDSVRSLDTSPAVFGMALNEALLQVQVHQAFNPRGN